MLKDFFEDRKRHKSDAEENNRQTLMLPVGATEFVRSKAEDIRVG